MGSISYFTQNSHEGRGGPMIVEMSSTEAYEVLLHHVQFEVTGRCNMSCSHCRAWNEHRIDLPLSTMKNILDFVENEKEGRFGVTISGGEPFMRQDLDEIVGLVGCHSVDDLTITTNGSLLTKAVAERIASVKKRPKVVIQVSLDNADRNNNDAFRGYPGAFCKAIESIGRIQDAGIVSTIRSTIRKGEIPSMRPLVQLAQNLGIRSIGLGTVVPFGRASDNSMGMDPAEKQRFFAEILQLRREFGSNVEILTEDPLRFALGCSEVWDYGGIEPDDDSAFGGCTAGINTFNVTSNSLLTPCAVLPCTILDSVGKDCWEIAREYSLSKIVKSLLARSFVGKCGSCGLRRVCGGCRAIPYALEGNLLGSDDTCWR